MTSLLLADYAGRRLREPFSYNAVKWIHGSVILLYPLLTTSLPLSFPLLLCPFLSSF